MLNPLELAKLLVSIVTLMKDTLKDLLLGYSLWKIWSRLAIREIQLSVKRTILGPVWLIMHRIFFAFAFTFLGAILWGSKVGLNTDILIGYMVFATMIGYLQSANTALISTINLADSGLPISIRFLKPWAKEFLLSLLSIAVIVLTSIISGTLSASTILMIACFTILMSIWGMGLIFAVSPIALRYRDIAQLVSFASIILMFFSPIFWKIEDIQNKELAQNVLTYNPIADFIFVFRDLVSLGTLNDEYASRILIQTVVVLIIGFLIFLSTRRKIPYWS